MKVKWQIERHKKLKISLGNSDKNRKHKWENSFIFIIISILIYKVN